MAFISSSLIPLPRQPQKGSIRQPRVVARRLPWVSIATHHAPTLKGLHSDVALPPKPRWGFLRFSTFLSQGSRCAATLGYLAQALRAIKEPIRMTIHRPAKFFAVPALFFATVFSSMLSAAEPKPAGAARPKPKITISKETTYITGPLREDGMVDYIAAINQRCSEGVTPENNAAIPFWRAVGPKSIDKKIRKQYFEKLGIAELPEKGEYLVPLDEFLPFYNGPKPPEGSKPEGETWEDVAEKQFELSQKSPWSREKYPVVAAMLEHNTKSLATFVEGVNRSHYYSPLVPTDSSNRMTSVLGQSGVSNSRYLVRCLMARAMLRMHEGDVAGAMKDIVACDRWGRLNSQGPFLIDHLLATTYQRYTSDAMAVLVQTGKLTADQTVAVLAEWQRPPEAVPVIESMIFGERLFGLGCLLDIAVNGSRWVETDLGSAVSLDILALFGLDKSQGKLFRQLADNPQVDWSEAFRCNNEWYDRLVVAYKTPAVAKRRELLAAFDKELTRLAKEAVAESAARDSTDPNVASRARARQLTHLIMGGMSAAAAVLNVENIRQTKRNLATLALALGGYRSDRGKYPKTLTELTPKYLAEIPKDVFSDGDLHYKLENDGYLLYSVGINGKDDAGRNFNEEQEIGSEYESATEEEKSRDDIAIRTPLKKDGKK